MCTYQSKYSSLFNIFYVFSGNTLFPKIVLYPSGFMSKRGHFYNYLTTYAQIICLSPSRYKANGLLYLPNLLPKKQRSKIFPNKNVQSTIEHKFEKKVCIKNSKKLLKGIVMYIFIKIMLYLGSTKIRLIHLFYISGTLQ